jgi:hypothetical protein
MANRALIVLAAFLLAAVVFPLQTSRVKAAGEPILVIVGLSFPENDIELADLKSAFTGRATYRSGMRLIPLNYAVGNPQRVAFDRAILGLEPAEVGRFWVDRRIRDEGTPPKTVPSVDLAIRVAAALPGAVTYGTTAQLSAKVKALTVDGVKAGDRGYLLNR